MKPFASGLRGVQDGYLNQSGPNAVTAMTDCYDCVENERVDTTIPGDIDKSDQLVGRQVTQPKL